MGDLSWDKYYASFYDWSLSTQKKYSFRLRDYGNTDEVIEIVNEFSFYDEVFASQFVKRAITAGVHFDPDQVLEMANLIDKEALSIAAETAIPQFNREQLEEIYMLIDDQSFQKISVGRKIDVFDDEIEEVADEDDEDLLVSRLNNNGSGLLQVLIGLVGYDKHRKRNRGGRCNGDCANCPPHYGYRYARWYYGHSHNHGCEFGGNKGDGSL